MQLNFIFYSSRLKNLLVCKLWGPSKGYWLLSPKEGKVSQHSSLFCWLLINSWNESSSNNFLCNKKHMWKPFLFPSQSIKWIFIFLSQIQSLCSYIKSTILFKIHFYNYIPSKFKSLCTLYTERLRIKCLA